MLSAFQLITLDFWENIYNHVSSSSALRVQFIHCWELFSCLSAVSTFTHYGRIRLQGAWMLRFSFWWWCLSLFKRRGSQISAESHCNFLLHKGINKDTVFIISLQSMRQEHVQEISFEPWCIIFPLARRLSGPCFLSPFLTKCADN